MVVMVVMVVMMVVMAVVIVTVWTAVMVVTVVIAAVVAIVVAAVVAVAIVELVLVCVFLLTSESTFRHLNVKHGPRKAVFSTIDLQTRLLPRWRSLFQHFYFQKWSEHRVLNRQKLHSICAFGIVWATVCLVRFLSPPKLDILNEIDRFFRAMSLPGYHQM